jgi:hypothetical protein
MPIGASLWRISQTVPKLAACRPVRRIVLTAERAANRRTAKVTSIPEITRMIALIEDWKEGHGKARGRAETDRALSEAHKLFDELSNLLTEMRRELLGRGRQQR